MSGRITRRELTVGAVGATMMASSRAIGANNRVRLGFIGTANRGGQLITAALPSPDMEIVALCDVHRVALDKQTPRIQNRVELYSDYRKLLERKDVDAVVIATPDHWHALQMIDAVEAGKDVFIEKPLSMTIHEGRKMVEAARRTNRIVQVGLHRRSSTLYPQLKQLIQSDGIGKVTVARAYRLSNMWPNGIGKAPDQSPPSDLDWDAWLGPRPKRSFRPTIAPYKFRWWQAYSSQVANWGVHYFDVIRWMLGDEAPASITAMGGKFAVDDDRDIPDTMEITCEMPSGRLLVFGQYEASGYAAFPRGEFELRGTKGVVYADDRGFDVHPEKGGQFQSPELRLKAQNVISQDKNLDYLHMRNFLDCVKSRQTPNCDVEEGHKSTIFALLANISLATRSRIDWDPAKERITNSAHANNLLHYKYRPPYRLG
jgi:predicted dehydrogenase